VRTVRRRAGVCLAFAETAATTVEAVDATAEVLAQATATVLRDCPQHPHLVEAAAEERRWWLDEWPDGAAYILCLLAQDVQESVQAKVDPDWPLCPEHGDHALLVEPDLGPDPFWVCHRTGLPVAQVGSL
jgi:hypothetical protein